MANKSILKKGQAEQGEEVCVEPPVSPIDLPLAVSGEESEFADELAGGEVFQTGLGFRLDAGVDEAVLDRSEAEMAIDDARLEAASIRSAARQEAETLVSQARAEAAKIRAAAERDAAIKGEALESEVTAQLQRDYTERYNAAIGALEGAARELRERRQEYLDALEQPAYRLVLEIARRLTGAGLRHDPGIIAGLIAQAFALLNPGQVARVRLNPQACERLREDEKLTAALAAAGIRPSLVELEADPALRPEQFSLEVGGVSIDYDLEASLREMIEHLEHRSQGYNEDEAAPEPAGQ